MRLRYNGIDWGRSLYTKEAKARPGFVGEDDYYISVYLVNSISRKAMLSVGMPLVGFSKTWYDRPHCQFCFYWFTVCWSTQWSTFDFSKD